MDKDKLTQKLNTIFIYLSILVCDFLFLKKYIDFDLFFDIRSAEDILKYGLDFKDHMSMFDGLKYYYHHWLYDLLIYPIFKLGGFKLVFIFFYIIFVLLTILVYKFLKNKTNSKFVSFISVLVLAITIGDAFFPRVKCLGYLLMFIQFVSIYNLYTKGEVKYSIISIILSILLVNLHFPLWMLVPIFYLPYLAELIYDYIKNKFKIKIFDNKIKVNKCSNKKIFIITFIIILFTCFISPYGLIPYTFFLDMKPYYQDVYSHIREMYFVVIIKNHEILLCLLYFIIFLTTNKKISFSNLCYLVGLGLFGLMYSRNVPYLLMYFIIIITWELFENSKLDKYKFKRINLKVNKIIIYIFSIILLICGFIVGINDVGFNAYKYGAPDGMIPFKITDYIVDNLDYKNLKFYNTFDTGSYLAFKHIPTFIDTRVEVFLKKFNGKEDIMLDYYKYSPKKLIDKYKFDYFIVNSDSDMYDYLIENNYELITSEKEYFYLFKNNIIEEERK